MIFWFLHYCSQMAYLFFFHTIRIRKAHLERLIQLFYK